MTIDTQYLKDNGYHQLTIPIAIPEEGELLGRICQQLDLGKHHIEYIVYHPTEDTAEVWAIPIVKTYSDRL